MQKPVLKKALLWTAGSLFLLLLILSVHIYMVTRTKPPDAHTLVMARIDIHQEVTPAQSVAITTWMYQQKGMDHVVCNPASRNIVFTFFPVQTSGNEIVSRLKSTFHLQADRYMPTEAEMRSGCPVASNSPAYKMTSFIKHLF